MFLLLLACRIPTPDTADSACVTSTWYADADGDGHGDGAATKEACDAAAGWVASDDDCDDALASVYPGAPEYCNAIDDDCDGSVDEEAVDATIWYADGDGDGFGDAGSTEVTCVAAAGWVASDDDCDDALASVYPGAPEYCNAVDDDCDGNVDEDAVDATIWYVDGDGDGFGDAGSAEVTCVAAAGWVAGDDDCDDTAATVNPDAPEYCNAIDDDCDGSVDDDALDATTWYVDSDGDGYGQLGAERHECEAPPGWAAGSDDCDDSRSFVYPGAPESCNSRDDDCDTSVDEDAVDAPLWYQDADGDGHGDPAYAQPSCDAVSGSVASGDDCDELSADVYPGAPEYCNAIDDDCDGSLDEDPVDGLIWYADLDGDGYGEATSPIVACEIGPGRVADATDCDDADAGTFPGGPENLADGLDNDCDGRIDEVLVCADGTGDFATIQEGVDGTPDGGTIDVCPGSYDEAVSIADRVLNIIGAGEQASDVVFSYSGYYALDITGAGTDVTIQNVSFTTANLGGNAAGNVVFDGVDFCTNNTSGFAYLYFPYGGSSFSVSRSYFCPAAYAYVYSYASSVQFQENVVEMADGSWMTVSLDGERTQINNNLIIGGALTMRMMDVPSSSYTEVYNNTFADGDAVTISIWDVTGRNAWDSFSFQNNIVANMANTAAQVFTIGYSNHAWTPDCSIYVPSPFTPNASWGLSEGWLSCQGFDTSGDELDPVYSDAQAGLFSAGFTDEDPMFASSPGMGDYALDPASPCVDAGSGDRDPDGSRADLGAFGGADGDWWERVPWLE